MKRLTKRYKRWDGNAHPKKIKKESCYEYCDCKCEYECEICIIGECFNRLAYYEDLEEAGLLIESPIEVPCKIGQKIWYIYMGSINSGYVSEIRITPGRVQIICDNIRMNPHAIFTSYEDAKRYLDMED